MLFHKFHMLFHVLFIYLFIFAQGCAQNSSKYVLIFLGWLWENFDSGEQACSKHGLSSDLVWFLVLLCTYSDIKEPFILSSIWRANESC